MSQPGELEKAHKNGILQHMTETKTRILHIVTRGHWGGAQKYVHTLATKLPTKFESHVAVGTGDALPEILQADGIPVHRLISGQRFVSMSKDIALWKEIYSLITKIQPSIVHLNSSKVGAVGACAARTYNLLHRTDKRVKIVFTSHGWAFKENVPFYSQWFRFCSQWVTALLSDCVICVSENVKKHAQSMMGVQNKLVTIYNGVEAPAFLAREDAHMKLAPHVTAHTWIGTISELVPNKGLDILIDAFSRIASDFPDAHMVVIGEGEQRLELEQLIHTKNIENRITLCGHVYEASRLLPAFDIFTLTSRKEGFPYALLEAGHASLPILTTRVGGIPEIIENTVSGILVRPGDVRETEVALRRLLEHAELRTQLGEALHTKVTTMFSEQNMITRTTELYRGLLNM